VKDTLKARVRFGVFELDLKAGELREGGRKIVLQEQSLRVLRILVEHDGEIASREEIQNKLWPNDTIVEFDRGINAVINKLRRLLGDSAEDPKYIETVARRGYRLMVPVKWIDSNAGNAPPTPDIQEGLVDAPGLEPPTLIGKTVTHYRVQQIIGGGGMGVVYSAEDLKLPRSVALKFLPEELGNDPRALERFELEARAASVLEHPNICPIYEFGEHAGRPFIVMQLLTGQTLRDRMAARAADAGKPPEPPFAVDELLDIAIQIARGLEAAHEKGVIHRDIKPANIFLTDKGVVKILDFGLAKLLQPSGEIGVPLEGDEPTGVVARPAEPGDTNLTRLGVAVGTEGYMSPEQVRSEQVDACSDLFSFGVVLYEMATGQRAFSGKTEAVVRVAIAQQAPAPVHELNPALPLELEPIINKALEMDRALRYQSAAEMRADLEAVKRRREPVPLPSFLQPPKPRPWKAWQLAVAVALVCAVIAGVAYWLWPRKITDVVLADFTNSTTDPAFNEALNTALRVELEQTPYLNLLAADKVRGILKSLDHPDNQRLTPELASEVCLRSNSQAVVGGSIRDAGNRYHIELKATDCETGKTLFTTATETANRDEIVKALGVAGNEFRRKLGEPPDSLQKFKQPLEQATSSSLEALQAFTDGVEQQRQHGPQPALPYFRRAAELDPNFAQAYAALGMGYRNDNQPKPTFENLKKAYELRDRATQRQRFFIDGVYFWAATGEREKAINAFTEWTKIYPKDPNAHVRLSAVSMDVGQYERAAAEARESIRLQPNAAAFTDEVLSYLKMNRLDEAKAGLDEAQSLHIASQLLPLVRYRLAFLQNDLSAMEQHAGGVLCLHSFTQAYYGRIARERELLDQVVERALHDHAPDSAADCIVDNAILEAEAGNSVRARQQAAAALELSTGRDIEAQAALAFARAGELDEAEKLSQQLNQDYPKDTLMQNYSLPTIRAAIELQRNNPTAAIEMLKVALPYETGGGSFAFLYPAYVRGEAYLKLGQAQQAAAEFQKILDHPGIMENWVTGALAHLQLARVQATMGDTAAARQSYQDFLALWKDADSDVPIYLQAKTEYARLR
jgi:eukaryotic-like serine/threonine-protein kinase